MLGAIVLGMNQINRLEETWTPEWDLGLQESFGFMDVEVKEEEVVPVENGGWSLATKEVLNRQSTVNRRVDNGASSIGALIAFFESEFGTEGANHE